MDNKTTTGFINEIITVFINEIPILVVGLIIAYFVHRLQNRHKVIVNKAWIEGKQKLDIENIIEIINGTKELISAIKELSILIVTETTEMLSNYHMTRDLRGHYTGPQIMEIAMKNFNEASMIENQKIENFIFLLERDIIINEKNPAMEQEIKLIEQEIEIIKNIRARMGEAIIKGNIATITRDDVLNIVSENKDIYIKEETDDEVAIKQSIKNILDIYKPRLDRNKKKSRLQDKP